MYLTYIFNILLQILLFCVCGYLKLFEFNLDPVLCCIYAEYKLAWISC